MIQEKAKQWKSSSFNFRSWHPRRYRPALGMWPPWWWTYLQVPRHCCGSISCHAHLSPIKYFWEPKNMMRESILYHYLGYRMILVILANDTQHPYSLNKHIHLSELSLLPPCQVHWKCIWMVKCISIVRDPGGISGGSFRQKRSIWSPRINGIPPRFRDSIEFCGHLFVQWWKILEMKSYMKDDEGSWSKGWPFFS